MMQLNTCNWRFFEVNRLFDIAGTVKKEPTDFKGYGPYPLISSRTSNNGALGFFDSYEETGNVLVIETACNGHCTYQKENFSGHGHLAVLCPRFDMNERIALFFVTIFNHEKFLFNYGRKCSIRKIKKRRIKLPVKADLDVTCKYSENGYVPDWEFMDDYMKSLLCHPLEKSGALHVSYYWSK